MFLRLWKLLHPALRDPQMRVERSGAVESGEQREANHIDRRARPRRPRVERAVAGPVTAHRDADLDARIYVVRDARRAREVVDPILWRLFAENARAFLQRIDGGNQIVRLEPSRDSIDVLEARNRVGLARLLEFLLSFLGVAKCDDEECAVGPRLLD